MFLLFEHHHFLEEVVVTGKSGKIAGNLHVASFQMWSFKKYVIDEYKKMLMQLKMLHMSSGLGIKSPSLSKLNNVSVAVRNTKQIQALTDIFT